MPRRTGPRKRGPASKKRTADGDLEKTARPRRRARSRIPARPAGTKKRPTRQPKAKAKPARRAPSKAKPTRQARPKAKPSKRVTRARKPTVPRRPARKPKKEPSRRKRVRPVSRPKKVAKKPAPRPRDERGRFLPKPKPKPKRKRRPSRRIIWQGDPQFAFNLYENYGPEIDATVESIAWPAFDTEARWILTLYEHGEVVQGPEEQITVFRSENVAGQFRLDYHEEARTVLEDFIGPTTGEAQKKYERVSIEIRALVAVRQAAQERRVA